MFLHLTCREQSFFFCNLKFLLLQRKLIANKGYCLSFLVDFSEHRQVILFKQCICLAFAEQIILVDMIYIFGLKWLHLGQFPYGDYESEVTFFLSHQDFSKSAI